MSFFFLTNIRLCSLSCKLSRFVLKTCYRKEVLRDRAMWQGFLHWAPSVEANNYSH